MNSFCKLTNTQKIDNNVFWFYNARYIYSLQYFVVSCAAFLIFFYDVQLKKVIKLNHIYKGKNNKQGEKVEEEDKKRVRNSGGTAELEKRK